MTVDEFLQKKKDYNTLSVIIDLAQESQKYLCVATIPYILYKKWLLWQNRNHAKSESNAYVSKFVDFLRKLLLFLFHLCHTSYKVSLSIFDERYLKQCVTNQMFQSQVFYLRHITSEFIMIMTKVNVNLWPFLYS